jgi:hypothetical protein
VSGEEGQRHYYNVQHEWSLRPELPINRKGIFSVLFSLLRSHSLTRLTHPHSLQLVVSSGVAVLLGHN